MCKSLASELLIHELFVSHGECSHYLSFELADLWAKPQPQLLRDVFKSARAPKVSMNSFGIYREVLAPQVTVRAFHKRVSFLSS